MGKEVLRMEFTVKFAGNTFLTICFLKKHSRRSSQFLAGIKRLDVSSRDHTTRLWIYIEPQQLK